MGGGLAKLLHKLGRDGVARRESFGPSAVAEWWREYTGGKSLLRATPEPLISNCYGLRPTTLHFHELARDSVGLLEIPKLLPYPAVRHNQYLVSFAPAADFDGLLGASMRIRATTERRFNDPDAAPSSRLWSFREERAALAGLLRQTWERALAERKLPAYSFSGRVPAFYFSKGMVPDDKLWYTGVGGDRAWRSVVGYKSTGGATGIRYWHFALEAKPTSHPVYGYLMKPHVLFSDDGVQIWNSPRRLHRARRSQCAGWWNDRWRDLIAAATTWLADSSSSIELSAGRETRLAIAATPLVFRAPVSFDDDRLEATEQDATVWDGGSWVNRTRRMKRKKVWQMNASNVRAGKGKDTAPPDVLYFPPNPHSRSATARRFKTHEMG